MLADDYQHGIATSMFEQEAAALDEGRNQRQTDVEDVAMAQVGNQEIYGEDEAEFEEPRQEVFTMKKKKNQKITPQEYDIKRDDSENENEDQHMTAKEQETQQSILEGELLFWEQGIGTIKRIAGSDVFVKREGCEDCLQSLIKMVKSDPVKKP